MAETLAELHPDCLFEDLPPEAVRIGMRVKFLVHRLGGDEPPYPVFVPAEGT